MKCLWNKCMHNLYLVHLLFSSHCNALELILCKTYGDLTVEFVCFCNICDYFVLVSNNNCG